MAVRPLGFDPNEIPKFGLTRRANQVHMDNIGDDHKARAACLAAGFFNSGA
jgi:hypothetical protein